MSSVSKAKPNNHGRVGYLLYLAAMLMAPLSFAEETLQVKGSFVESRSFTLRDFAELPQTELTESRGVGVGQGQETTQVKWRGVLLRDVLNAANFHEKERRDARGAIILAKARDGYVAVFTWGELYNTKIGDSILVITSVDGKPLLESEGPYALRSLADIRPGPRHVKWLQQIEVVLFNP